MKKRVCTMTIAVTALLLCPGCTDETYPSEIHEIPVHIRNTSTVSGITLTAPWLWSQHYNAGLSVTLDPSPQPGIPVDSTRTVQGPHTFAWRAERTTDSVVFDSGSIHIDSRTWVLIEGDNGNWSCIWSDEPWQ